MTHNGADLLVSTLAENGIDTCFANPGTTEMHLLAALGRHNRVTTHLCLFEGVATGAADGYARMARRPAATLLHLGPGFANGMANLHNARKAGSPVVNIVGEHATYHAENDAPLAADIEGMAQTVSHLVVTCRSADTVSRDTTALLEQVCGPAGQIGTLIVPNDVAWSGTDAEVGRMRNRPDPDDEPSAIEAAVRLLEAGGNAALIIGAPFITGRAAKLAQAIGQRTGCRVFAEAAVARMERGGDIPPVRRIPFHVDLATDVLKGVMAVVLAGARAPVAFFAYPGRQTQLQPEQAEIVSIDGAVPNLEKALAALAEALGAEQRDRPPEPVPEPEPSAITAEQLGIALARTMPDNAIVVDESVTNGGYAFNWCGNSVRHDWMNNRGGSIGYSMPVAIGAAIACPDRRVITVTGDGSAFYTMQSLWTMARARLDVTVLILANRSYRILENEMTKIGAGEANARTRPLISLTDPVADWVDLARGQGVRAERAETVNGLIDCLQRSHADMGPKLIEVLI